MPAPLPLMQVTHPPTHQKLCVADIVLSFLLHKSKRSLPVCQTTSFAQPSHTNTARMSGVGERPHLPPSPPPLNLPVPSYLPNSNYVYHHKAFTLSPRPHKILWNIYIFLLLDLKPSTVVTEILCKSSPIRILYPTPLHYILQSH